MTLRPGSGTTRRRGSVVIGLMMLIVLSACRYPDDVQHTLQRIEGGTMHVGLAENRPWVIQTDGEPAGLEPEILRALAEQLGARIQWHWGSESQLLQALQQYQLDIVVAGFVEKSPMSKETIFSKAYHQDTYRVGFPAHSDPIPSTLKNLKVQLARVNHIGDALRDQGAIPVDLIASTEGPVAAPEWWLQAHGLQPGPWKLATDAHVMALPPGENAWILAVQRHLTNHQDLAERLRIIEATHAD